MPTHYQLPQTNHALVSFAIEHNEQFKQWQKTSNTIVVLETKTLSELANLADSFTKQGISFSKFHEPDILNELTALCVLGTAETKKLLSKLPLAGKKITGQECQQDYLKARFELTAKMLETKQADNKTNVLQHGIEVFEVYKKLLNEQTKDDFYCYDKNIEQIVKNLTPPSEHIVERYCTIHDCGKPFSKSIDENNLVHFNNSSKISACLARTLYPEEKLLHLLIENDMLFHTYDTEKIIQFINKNGFALTNFLIVIAYCAIHANKKMFGEESFKIKIKNLLAKIKKVNNELKK